ncbi:hypothetical protein BXZ70DRAFT_132921 [Cristinia sonorae]|uniref:Uncharacterized protein n=1 Tax=Cristinia sonorae TaxID=1940300 RepID=A0A8K0XQ45_9AGAR|nr:hypothetical protein BXZ70DRAFT_132921 [Cristinia sonorae]
MCLCSDGASKEFQNVASAFDPGGALWLCQTDILPLGPDIEGSILVLFKIGSDIRYKPSFRSFYHASDVHLHFRKEECLSRPTETTYIFEVLAPARDDGPAFTHFTFLLRIEKAIRASREHPLGRYPRSSLSRQQAHRGEDSLGSFSVYLLAGQFERKVIARKAARCIVDTHLDGTSLDGIYVREMENCSAKCWLHLSGYHKRQCSRWTKLLPTFWFNRYSFARLRLLWKVVLPCLRWPSRDEPVNECRSVIFTESFTYTLSAQIYHPLVHTLFRCHRLKRNETNANQAGQNGGRL